MAPFRGFTGNLNKKVPTGINRPGTSSSAFSGYSKPSLDQGPGSGYTPGGDTYTNYSQKIRTSCLIKLVEKISLLKWLETFSKNIQEVWTIKNI